MSQTTTALATATSRDQARQILAPLTVGQLRQVAADLDIYLRIQRRTAIIDTIVQATVGSRLDHGAILHGQY